MRLELAGSLIQPDPLVITFTTNQNFIPQTYIDLGYTHFDVICIGGGGGMGGGVDTGNAGTLIRNHGGSGGGGGYHRVQGLLAALSATCPVVVGAGGIRGFEGNAPASTTDGGDGGASTFNSTTCRASGGKGGKRSQSNSATVTTQAHGGDGGIGNRSTAGGGAAGGTCGTPNTLPANVVAGTDGTDGLYANNIGKGGGGGAGGVGKYGLGNGTYYLMATNGGRGSYNSGDISVYGPGGLTADSSQNCGAKIIPGNASGAKASPLNGLPTIFGQSIVNQFVVQNSNSGIVVLRLTAE